MAVSVGWPLVGPCADWGLIRIMGSLHWISSHMYIEVALGFSLTHYPMTDHQASHKPSPFPLVCGLPSPSHTFPQCSPIIATILPKFSTSP